MLNFPDSDWKTVLKTEFSKDYFVTLTNFVTTAYENSTCYPPRDVIFEAFKLCSFKDVKVVIIGQDPYHGAGEADGLCFSVSENCKIPPSLHNIFKEIQADLNGIFLPSNGNLMRWAEQGVLLLNATLTVENKIAGSHQKKGWEQFTDAVISKINNEKQGVVFLLWGNYAQKKGTQIDGTKHLVLTSGHPSPLSANQGKWFGNKHFSQTNAYLKKRKTTQIQW